MQVLLPRYFGTLTLCACRWLWWEKPRKELENAREEMAEVADTTNADPPRRSVSMLMWHNVPGPMQGEIFESRRALFLP